MAKLNYTKALFEIGSENNKLDVFCEDIKNILELYKNEPIFMKMLLNPSISFNIKEDILKKSFENNISEEVASFFLTIIKKGNGKYVLDIFNSFLAIVEKEKKIVTAEIVSFYQLSKEQITKIEEILSFKLEKKVRAKTFKDSTILGGLIIKVDGKIIDASLKKHLYDMKNKLLELQLV